MNVNTLPFHFRKSGVVLLALLLLLLVSASTGYAQENTTRHTVRRGEYLALIARQYGTTVQAILNANPSIKNPNLIYSGTVLVIPVSAPGGPPQGTIQLSPPAQPAQPVSQPARTSCRFQHLIRYGDNLIRLGQHYGVSPFAIAEANRIYNLNHIFAGQYLCIP